MKSFRVLLVFLLISSTTFLQAQSPISGFMQNKGNGSLVFSYNLESYDEVYLVPQKVYSVPIFKRVEINSLSFYGTYAITDKLNLVLNLPYIQSKGNASSQVLKNLNYENTREGLQDVAAYLKYNPINISVASGNLSLVGALGLKTPVGNYKVDEGLQSIIAIGNRATTISGSAIALYKHQSGFFTSGQLGYAVRTNNVPSAFTSEFKIGLAANYYVDAYIANQISTGGTDILAEGFQGFFPSTKVNFMRVGLNSFFPVYGGFGLGGGASMYIDGRNLGKSTSVYASGVFSF